jgi:hypothetical protein
MTKQKATNNTREKLAGSYYFLDKMLENQEDRDATTSPFIFNFDAFLALFRAITAVMQTELANYPGFKEWYADQREWMEADPQMRLLSKMRNIVLHKGSAPREMALEISVPTVDAGEMTVLAPTITIVDKDGNVVQQPAPKKEAIVPTRWKIRTTDEAQEPSFKTKWHFTKTPEIKKILGRYPDLDVSSFLNTDMTTMCKTCLDKLESVITDYFEQEPKSPPG